ncbi:hypothetical protein DPMN_077929 [Dreissena polymorpha]|uniref:Uncharacterized protein n=1 Tax=Dreissena polymorpha TaxID=45954 RepID=A0A9D4BRR6_DREPO|nr:hypothetical protein DPMN_077929 [Dreissena polymorpha]
MAPLAVTGCRLHPRDGFPSALSALGTAAPGPLFKATPRCSWVHSPQKEPRVRPVCPSTGGLAIPPYPSLYRRDLWTGTGRRSLDDKQRIGQIRCIQEKTAVSAVKKTSGSRVTDWICLAIRRRSSREISIFCRRLLASVATSTLLTEIHPLNNRCTLIYVTDCKVTIYQKISYTNSF